MVKGLGGGYNCSALLLRVPWDLCDRLVVVYAVWYLLVAVRFLANSTVVDLGGTFAFLAHCCCCLRL